MDPLNIATNIVTVIQATNRILKICYQLRTLLKDGATDIILVISELRDLRTILERLEETADDLNDKSRPAFQFLCDENRGPLGACIRELNQLDKTLGEIAGSKRKAVLQTLGLSRSDDEIRSSLDRIGRCKSSLSLALSADQTSMLRSLMKSTEELNQCMDVSIGTLRDLSLTITRNKAEGDFRAIMHWLAPRDISESHRLAQKMRHPDTCRWIEKCRQYLSWTTSSKQRILWATATPGAGKTILFSNLVDHLTATVAKDQERRRLLAYFYCDFRHSDADTLCHVFGALLGQLMASTNACPDGILEAYRGASRTQPKWERIRQCLAEICEEYNVFILVDGLDESNYKMELAKELVQLLRDTPETRLLVTSRTHVELGEAFANAERLRLEDHRPEIARDIRLYIKDRLRTDRRLSALGEDIQHHLTNTLNAKSGIMFRWVQCQLDSISAMRTVKAIKVALQGLPRGLYETYERILMNAEGADGELFRKLLLWLSFAVLPLSLEELAEAVSIEPGSDDIDPDTRLNNPLDILIIGGSLVTVSPNGSLRLAHLSVRDYLTSKEILEQPLLAPFALDKTQAQRELAQSCLTYLSFAEFAAGPARSAEAYRSRLSRYPLLTYASVAFSYHIRETARDESLAKAMREFFGKDGRNKFMSWIQILIADRDAEQWDVQLGHGAPIYYAASFGLTDVVRILIQDGVDLDAPGGRLNGAALHAAVFRQHHDIIQMLLDAGADPDVRDDTGYTPFRFAQVMRDAKALRVFEGHVKKAGKELPRKREGALDNDMDEMSLVGGVS